MDLNQNRSSTRGGSASLQPPASATKEVDLYDELLTFSDLSPEERLSQVNRALEQPESGLIESIAEQTGQAADSFPAFGGSGPLGNLNPEFPYTGSLSAGICLGCGAESGAEDLFCATCGTFVDEVGTGHSSNSKCAECGMVFSTNELFCPGCGAVLTSA